MPVHLLGIRHHGPGSARSVLQFLEALDPDVVLIEGPPEADAILALAAHETLKPPVAILAFHPDDPKKSVFFPFAEFSPEWQAIRYALRKQKQVRFMDLPIGTQLAMETQEETAPIAHDPISQLALADGIPDGEKWWERLFEYRRNNEQVFEAVAEAMHALREDHSGKEKQLELLREAHMRKTIRQAEKEMFTEIAVICGAWHVPALQHMPKLKDDNDLLKGMPKLKVECTWIPWSNSRLSVYSGYGAGILSPGWYQHLWHHPDDDGTRWMALTAALFRENGLDTSVAHVVEAVRLANTLAGLRGYSKAGLEELNEATLSVLCNGDTTPMHLVHQQLMVANNLGTVPDDVPKPPLQNDIEKKQKSLRLPPSADWKDYTLDLRKETDLERSRLLHRLLLLGIRWGEQTAVNGKGTFKEQWRLQWKPELSIDIIEKGAWGNTVEVAAGNYVTRQVNESDALEAISALLINTLPAELPLALDAVIKRIEQLSAATSDTIQLMQIVPELVNAARYGAVRQSDTQKLLEVVTEILTRVCISLPNACAAVSDDAAEHLLELIFRMNDAVNILQDAEIALPWENTLQNIAFSNHTTPVIAGYATRLLADRKLLEGADLAAHFSRAMSPATPAALVASWLEGFLKGSGTLLLIDTALWNVVNNWVAQLEENLFLELLPLIRRTFARFTAPERRKLGEKARQGSGSTGMAPENKLPFNEERAAAAIPLTMALLGHQYNVEK